MPPPSTSRTERRKTPSERTTHHREQCNQQKAPETAGQTSSHTSATLQPKVTTTKTAALAKQTPPARQSDSPHSPHESHSRDDCHRKETQQPHTTSRDSCQHECEEGFKQSFHQSPLKSTDYISPLHHDAEIQKHMEALKNPPKPVFKVSLLPPTVL
uniref:Uncharacterized protein n=1 Tax=Romanomermis culicivorax TaxID=13658 RepID=A0A915L965_ROMCU